MDVCSTDVRHDGVLGYSSIQASRDNCLSLYLPNNYRICSGTDNFSYVTSSFSSSFGTHADWSSYKLLNSENGNMILMNSSTEMTILSSFPVDDIADNAVIITVGDSKIAYMTSTTVPGTGSTYVLNIADYWLDTVVSVTLPSAITTVTGLAANLGGSIISVYSLDAASYAASVFVYSVESGNSQIATNSINCNNYYPQSSSLSSSSSSSADSTSRYISFGDDGYLYAICSTDPHVSTDKNDPSGTNLFDVGYIAVR
jgi:hypothetical protein